LTLTLGTALLLPLGLLPLATTLGATLLLAPGSSLLPAAAAAALLGLLGLGLHLRNLLLERLLLLLKRLNLLRQALTKRAKLVDLLCRPLRLLGLLPRLLLLIRTHDTPLEM